MGKQRFREGSDGWWKVERKSLAKPARELNRRRRPSNPASRLRRLFVVPQPTFALQPSSNSTRSLSPNSAPPTTNPKSQSHSLSNPNTSTPIPSFTYAAALLKPSVAVETPPLSSTSASAPFKPITSMAAPQPPSPTTAQIAWYPSDPSTKKAYSRDPHLNGRLPLELPPRAGAIGWRNRCFNCLVRGHPSSACRAPTMACARCLKPGHPHSSCPKRPAPRGRQQRTSSLLSPRGNLGEDRLSRHRPSVVTVIIPQTAESITKLQYLSRGVVIDARLRQGAFCSKRIQAALLSAAAKAELFPMLHLADERYLALLDEATNRADFLSAVKTKLEQIGLVPYPWSPAIDATPVV